MNPQRLRFHLERRPGLVAALLATLALVLAIGCGGGGAQQRGLTLDADAPASGGALPQVWTFAVGVSSYRESALNLQFAARDAEEIDRFFASPAGSAVPASRRVLLTDAAATRAEILGSFEKMTRLLSKNDLLVVFLAMHGVVTDRGDLYFAAHDTTSTNVRGTGLADTDIEQAVRDADVKHVLFLADTCHSGGVGLSGRRGVGAMEAHRLLASLADAKPGIAILSASRGAELSQEDARWGGGHGVFTHFVLAGMSGAADENHDQLVSVSELYDFVYAHVKDATSGGQHPELKGKFDNAMPVASIGGASAKPVPGAPAAPSAAGATAKAGGGKVCDFDKNEECQAECDKGNGESCYNAGYYLLGFSKSGSLARSRDMKAAVAFFRKGCDANNGDACNFLALAYIYGEQYETGIRLDRPKSLALATKGCDLGSAMSCHNLGVGWSRGDYYGDDGAKALGFFSKACSLYAYHGEGNLSFSTGHPYDRPDSCGRWAEILLRGLGVPQNISEALLIRTKACDAGDRELCWRLGDLYEDGVEPGFTSAALKDPAKAAVFKKKACALGYRATECGSL